jgi:hypothetical protein
MNRPTPSSQIPPSSPSSIPSPPAIPSPPDDNVDHEEDDESKIDEDQIFSCPPESEYFHRPSTINELTSSSFSYQQPAHENISIFGMDYIYDLKDSFTLSNHDHSFSHHDRGQQQRQDQESLLNSSNCNHIPSTPNSSSTTTTPPPSPSQSLHHLLHKEMKKLYHIINEFLSTEISYVHDINLLTSMLHDCYYCTIPCVKLFVDSKSFGGFYVSCDNILQINTQFLEKLKNITVPLYTINDITAPLSATTADPLPTAPATATAVVPTVAMADQTKYLQTLLSLIDHLTTLFSQYFQHFTQYKHFITFHRPLSLLFSSFYSDDINFQNYIDTQQQRYGSDTFLSLSIKPVQRLPRYVLLCKEMHNTLHKILQYFHPNTHHQHPVAGVGGVGGGAGEVEGMEEIYQQIYHARQSIYGIHTMISNCTLLCNNTMRDYEDLQQLHQLHHRLYGQQQQKQQQQQLPIVVKGRIYIREGELYRQHRRGGLRMYLVYLFNDMMIFCTSTGGGRSNSLKLELTIPLYRNSNTLCLSLPSPVLLPPSHVTPNSGTVHSLTD